MAFYRKIMVGLGIALFAAMASATQFDMPQGVTAVSQDVYHLHRTILWICIVIGIIVFGAMFYSMINHRRSKHPKPAHFHENLWVEIIWTVIPTVILVVMAIPATKTLLAMHDPSDADMTVQITGYQWKWHYKYVNDDLEFFSVLSTPREQFDEREGKGQPKGEHYLLEVDQPLVLPINKKIRFLVTANDVIHSWWVPDFAVKKDAVPGFINETWTKIDKPGVYRGQCAELCGKDHGFMPIVVIAKEEEDYKQWLVEQKKAKEEAKKAAESDSGRVWTKDELMLKGEEVYKARCAVCHQENGLGMPPTFPALKDSKLALGEPGPHVQIVLHGKAGTGMQAFGPQLSDAEIAAVITYERNAWGNNKGDLIQPADIKAAR